jgi:transcriptional regulator with XRE-family HTH domain
MAKSSTRSYSRYTQQAVRLLGMQVRTHRLERRITTAELAERAGISRDLLYRVEKGDPRVTLGVAFELAAIVGVPLFEADPKALDARERQIAEKLSLLPGAVRKRKEELKDDF